MLDQGYGFGTWSLYCLESSAVSGKPQTHRHITGKLGLSSGCWQAYVRGGNPSQGTKLNDVEICVS
jgi:hypothetical protein